MGDLMEDCLQRFLTRQTQQLLGSDVQRAFLLFSYACIGHFIAHLRKLGFQGQVLFSFSSTNKKG